MVVDEGEEESLYMLEGYLAQGWPLIILVGTKLYSLKIFGTNTISLYQYFLPI